MCQLTLVKTENLQSKADLTRVIWLGLALGAQQFGECLHVLQVA